jgi:hypothetical protein
MADDPEPLCVFFYTVLTGANPSPLSVPVSASVYLTRRWNHYLSSSPLLPIIPICQQRRRDHAIPQRWERSGAQKGSVAQIALGAPSRAFRAVSASHLSSYPSLAASSSFNPTGPGSLESRSRSWPSSRSPSVLATHPPSILGELPSPSSSPTPPNENPRRRHLAMGPKPLF